MTTPSLEFQPLTPERWSDLVALFDHHGNPGYCWCMTWRLTGAHYRQSSHGERFNLS